jgi:hypothetical protein
VRWLLLPLIAFFGSLGAAHALSAPFTDYSVWGLVGATTLGTAIATAPLKASFAERIEHAFRVVAVMISLAAWVFVFPVWFAFTCWAILAFAMATVRDIYGGAGRPDPTDLNQQASAWVRGFGDILSALTRPGEPVKPPRSDYFEERDRARQIELRWKKLFRDAFYAAGFYAFLYLHCTGELQALWRWILRSF